MPTFQTQLLNEIAVGPDGPTIPESKRVYFQERCRARLFDFIIGRFLSGQKDGLTKAKLARRIGKPPEVINRWLGAPSNLTIDSLSDLLLGIGAEEPEFTSSSVLNRTPTNYFHLAEGTDKEVRLQTEAFAKSSNSSTVQLLSVPHHAGP